MKAITLYEPWASLMRLGAKLNETRPMRTTHRGDICIHAAKRPVEAIERTVLDAFRNRAEPLVWHPGCIVAVVEIYDVQPSDKFRLGSTMAITLTEEEFAFGNYSHGRFIYRTRNLRRLATPVPARGLQCVGWTVPPDVEALVRQQVVYND